MISGGDFAVFLVAVLHRGFFFLIMRRSCAAPKGNGSRAARTPSEH
jgi:hypothetical protein